MSRYIDADALIAELQKDEERFDKEAEDCRKNSSNYTDCYMQAMSSRADGIRDAIVEVYDAPSIDIEPKRGEWIDMGDFEQCSVCKGTHLKEFQSYYGKTTWIKTPYCPKCGARMKGADDE